MLNTGLPKVPTEVLVQHHLLILAACLSGLAAQLEARCRSC